MQIIVEKPGSIAAMEGAFLGATGLAREAVTFFHNLDEFIAGASEPWVEVLPLEGDFQFMLQAFAPWADAHDEDAVAEAMSMLKGKLYELELRKREEAADATNAQKTDNAWGHQIRSYVLHPYQMVKDLRTGVETGNTQAVLDGALDDFMSAVLAGQVREK